MGSVMTFYLDWKLFGNGHGMASPYCDDVFYWLSGRFYRWFGGLGAQLSSIEWFAPPAGTRRRLFGHEFVVFRTSRKLVRVEVSWELAGGVRDFAHVTELKTQLQAWGHGL